MSGPVQLRRRLLRFADEPGFCCCHGHGWRGLFLVLVVLVLWLAGGGSTWGQGTREDYARAAGLAERFRGKLVRDGVRPHWFDGGRRFWYRVDEGDGRSSYVLVDADSGERGAAFDESALVSALVARGVEGVRVGELDLAGLELDTEVGVMRFRLGGKSWRWSDRTGQLEEGDGGDVLVAASVIPRRSRGNGPETFLTFANRTEVEVEVVWLDAEGQRRGYGRIPPGGRRRQHTFAGHAWLVVDAASGVVLAGCEATDEPSILEVVPGMELQLAGPEREQVRRRGEVSPDGRWEAYEQDGNLWVRQLGSAGGESRALSVDGSAAQPYRNRVVWSPDSSRLLGFRVTPGDVRKVDIVESSPKEGVQPRLLTFDYAKPGDRLEVEELRLFILDGGEVEQVEVAPDDFPNPYELRDFRWSPDGARLSFITIERGHQVVRLLSVDGMTGEVHRVVNEECETFFDYAHKLFARHLDSRGVVLWMSERSGWNHLYVVDLETGRVKHPVTSGEWVVRSVEHVDEDSGEVWLMAGGVVAGQDPYYLHLVRARLDGSGYEVLTEGDGYHRVQFSPDRRFFIDTWSRVDLPPVSVLRRSVDGTRVAALEEADASGLERAGWRGPERFVAKGRDGVTDIYGVIYRPLNMVEGRKYPVIEKIYAGPQGAYVPKEFREYDEMQALAELGFIVVQLDGMGTSYRSKAFHDVCWRNLADAGFPDRVSWIRAAAEHEPAMDLERVGIYGGSAGGQNAMRALLDHGDFYDVAVADCGCHDNRVDKMWWNELWLGWPVGAQYVESSNVEHAHRLQGKLLLIVGELDRNVDPASTMQVVDALVKADKDFDLLVIPGTGHGAAETPYGKRRRMDYFVRHLLGVEPRVR